MFQTPTDFKQFLVDGNRIGGFQPNATTQESIVTTQELYDLALNIACHDRFELVWKEKEEQNVAKHPLLHSLSPVQP